MKVLGTVTANSYQIVTNGDEAIGSMLSSDSKRGGGVAVVISADDRFADGERLSKAGNARGEE